MNSQTHIIAQQLEVDVPDSLDVTYQTIPVYDEKEHVLAGWNEQDLVYFVCTTKLPPGWLNASTWLAGFRREMCAVNQKPIDVLDAGQYASAGGHTVDYMSYRLDESSLTSIRYCLVSFIADATHSYAVHSSLVDPSAASRMFTETRNILSSARYPSGNVVSLETGRSIDPYVGIWSERCSQNAVNPPYTTLTLRDDLSYVGEHRRGDKLVTRCTGFWSVNGDRLYRDRVSLAPISADARATFCDQIESCNNQTLVLVSEQNGARQVFDRIS